MVKVKLVEPLSGMLAAPNALMITGGATTVTLALDVFPVPAVVAPTVALLFLTPAGVPLTFADTVHDVPGGRLAPLDLPADDTIPRVPVPMKQLFRLLM